MSTVIRPELSRSNRYHISKHRYNEWRELYLELCDNTRPSHVVWSDGDTAHVIGDIVGDLATMRADALRNMELIKRIAHETDEQLESYILDAVTNDRSYTYLQMVREIPCCRDTYYDRYRKFFYLLDSARG